MSDVVGIIANICNAMTQNQIEDGRTIIKRDYPFTPPKKVSRSSSKIQIVKVFMRDGFIDRYAGQRLIFGPALRLISSVYPVEFPYHSHWQMDRCHIAYWELVATIDHVKPIARGGLDEEANWATTSMRRNSIKANWTLEELSWELCPAGDINEWDGMTKWYTDYLESHKEYLKTQYYRDWYNAILKAKKTRGTDGSWNNN